MFTLMAFVLSWNVFALKPGTYTSYDKKLKDIKIEPFGNGVKLATCSEFDDGSCYRVEAVLHPEGPLWGGSGHFYIGYGNLRCQYVTKFKIRQKGENLKVDYYGPSFIPGWTSFACPTNHVVKLDWFPLENEFVLQPPCYPNPIFEKTRCF